MDLVRRVLAMTLTAVMFSPPAVLPSASKQNDNRAAALLAELQRAGEGAGGTVGVSAVHIESGQRIALLGDERFPMASVYKLPIAVKLFQQVESGRVNLQDRIHLSVRDYRPGHSPLAIKTNAQPATLTVEELLDWMLRESDNTACDAILRLAGGPEAVSARLRELGITGIDVNRPEVLLSADYSGVRELPPERSWSLGLFRKLFAQVSSADQKAANKRFSEDPRDTSTPDAMTELLSRLQRGEILSPSSRDRMFRLMAITRTGPARLSGELPAETIVIHKTGSMGAAATNDVGVITLPGSRGHVAIAVFVKASSKDLAGRERAIAEIARMIYDYFSSAPGETSSPARRERPLR